MACGTHKAADSYRKVKGSATQVITEPKTQVWEEFVEAMEQDFQPVPKKFWQTVWRLRRGKQNPVLMVLSVGGELLTSTESIVRRWKEFFEDLLNPNNTYSEEEAEL